MLLNFKQLAPIKNTDRYNSLYLCIYVYFIIKINDIDLLTQNLKIMKWAILFCNFCIDINSQNTFIDFC